MSSMREERDKLHEQFIQNLKEERGHLWAAEKEIVSSFLFQGFDGRNTDVNNVHNDRVELDHVLKDLDKGVLSCEEELEVIANYSANWRITVCDSLGNPTNNPNDRYRPLDDDRGNYAELFVKPDASNPDKFILFKVKLSNEKYELPIDPSPTDDGFEILARANKAIESRNELRNSYLYELNEKANDLDKRIKETDSFLQNPFGEQARTVRRLKRDQIQLERDIEAIGKPSTSFQEVLRIIAKHSNMEVTIRDHNDKSVSFKPQEASGNKVAIDVHKNQDGTYGLSKVVSYKNGTQNIQSVGTDGPKAGTNNPYVILDKVRKTLKKQQNLEVTPPESKPDLSSSTTYGALSERGILPPSDNVETPKNNKVGIPAPIYPDISSSAGESGGPRHSWTLNAISAKDKKNIVNAIIDGEGSDKLKLSKEEREGALSWMKRNGTSTEECSRLSSSKKPEDVEKVAKAYIEAATEAEMDRYATFSRS